MSRINARRLRGNRNDLIAHGLSNLLVVEPATALRVSSRGHEPKIKPAQDRFDFWLEFVNKMRTVSRCVFSWFSALFIAFKFKSNLADSSKIT